MLCLAVMCCTAFAEHAFICIQYVARWPKHMLHQLT